MDNREAKFILSAYRPGGQDANDPRFAEVLEQAHLDPILKRWFRDSIAFDTSVTEKFSTLPAPAGLRESIVAGAKVSRASKFTAQRRLWAVAAAIALATIIALVSNRPSPRVRLSGWQSEALNVISSLVREESTFDVQSRNAGELVAWLQANHAPAAQKIPQSLESLQSIGCKTFFWDGQPVSVICFLREDGGLIHLVVGNKSVASDHGLKGDRELVEQGKWATAIWREGDKICMIALEGSRDQLRSFLL